MATVKRLQVSFVGGAVAGTVAAFITTPFDVIKTARQTDLSAGTVFFKFFFKETPVGEWGGI
jgi:hypothetical protein